VPQLPPEQEPQEQEDVPATGAVVPPSLIVKLANTDMIRPAGFLQVGQSAGEVDWLKGRISSNLLSQVWHEYS
jgi:hypothetical protein